MLAERFRRVLGEPPMGCLTRWRLGLAALALTTTSQSSAQGPHAIRIVTRADADPRSKGSTVSIAEAVVYRAR